MVNTEGSQVISQTVVVRRHIKYFITDTQMSILVGSLLGDAYIHPLGKICFEQSDSQIEYLNWKYEKMKNLAYPKIARVVRFDKRSQKETVSYRFFLRQIFRPWRKVWYPGDLKHIPDDIYNWFTPLSLAVWYMDDGHLISGKAPIFASENFTKNEVLKISCFLKEKWNLLNFVQSNNRIRISQRSAQDFVKLIKQYITPSMRYKITLTP